MADAFREGFSAEDVFAWTKIDPWFLAQIEDLIRTESEVEQQGLVALDRQRLYGLKQKGFSDSRLASLVACSEQELRDHRHQLGIRPVYKRVDTCAAEFATTTAYLYSTYEEECESEPTNNRKIMVLGGGPNRIGH